MSIGVTTDNGIVVSSVFVVEDSEGQLLTLYLVKHTAYKLSKPYEIKEEKRLASGKVVMSSLGFFSSKAEATDELLELKTTVGRKWLEQ